MIKSTTSDFRVTERLHEGYLAPRGPYTVYRVKKRKLTSFEAAAELAALAGVPRDAVSMAGLKDKQGVTIQYMSVGGGRPVDLRSPGLTIEMVGRAEEELESRHSAGNSFEVVVRDVRAGRLERLRESARLASECGVPNYFDEQRFGNLKHGQGWVARDLMMGRREQALKRLITSDSPFDSEATRRTKRGLRDAWRDWKRCRHLAGKLGAHHSVFEHLARDPRDYPGAFRRIASRIRLIHLYAYQSHVWNRAVCNFLSETFAEAPHRVVEGIEGELYFPTGEFAAADLPFETFRLPGARLADVSQPLQRRHLERVLADEGLSKKTFNIEGIPGFGLKGEERALWLYPSFAPIRGLRDKRAASRESGQGADETKVRLKFDLPRGAYATMIVKRLLGGGPPSGKPRGERAGARRSEPSPARRPQPAHDPTRERTDSPWGSGSRSSKPERRGAPRTERRSEENG